MGTGEPLLSIADLSVGYGQSKVLFDISLDIAEGTLLALLGPNGAGKSTLARAVSGLTRAQAGSVTFGDLTTTNWPAYRMRRAGVVYVPEGRGIFPGLSVRDNLRLAVRRARTKQERTSMMDTATETFPALRGKLHQRAGSLSGGEQQMLALARALAVKPRLVIADEMSLGLAPRVVEDVFARLRTARQQGVTILLIEQFVHKAFELADSCAVLVQGHIVWQGSSGDDAAAQVVNQYLGRN